MVSFLFLNRLNVFLIRVYRISSKEHPGRSFKSQPSRGGGHSRGRSFTNMLLWGWSFDFVDIQTQFFPIVMVMGRYINTTYEEIGNTRKRELVRKPYENEKLRKHYNGKGYKKNINFVLLVDIY